MPGRPHSSLNFKSHAIEAGWMNSVLLHPSQKMGACRKIGGVVVLAGRRDATNQRVPSKQRIGMATSSAQASLHPNRKERVQNSAAPWASQVPGSIQPFLGGSGKKALRLPRFDTSPIWPRGGRVSARHRAAAIVSFLQPASAARKLRGAICTPSGLTLDTRSGLAGWCTP